jgi:hypothetical protein
VPVGHEPISVLIVSEHDGRPLLVVLLPPRSGALGVAGGACARRSTDFVVHGCAIRSRWRVTVADRDDVVIITMIIIVTRSNNVRE